MAVLRHAEPVVFASLSEGHDGKAAVVRGAVTQGWLGVTALTVPVSWQRGGVGTYLMGELLRWGAERGAGDVYLQVADENHAALGLYERRFRFPSAPRLPLPPAGPELVRAWHPVGRLVPCARSRPCFPLGQGSFFFFPDEGNVHRGAASINFTLRRVRPPIR